MIVVVFISLAIHCAFYLIIFSRLALYQEKSTPDLKHKSSIVICYKNEEENIRRHLQSILKQQYDELILVDDKSSDNTYKALNNFKTDKVSVLKIDDSSAGKKKALAKGIQKAKNDSILLTDADCRPASDHWSAYLTNKNTPFVLGYGPMNKLKGAIAVFSRFETYMTALQYLSYALIGIPYMGVGRNMRMDKEVFVTQKDQIKGENLASGDDDLMINMLASKDNTSICIHPDSFMYSNPKTTIKSFLRQKSRHISTSVYYRPVHQILLSLFSASQILFFIALILGFILGTITFKIALLLLLAKWIIQQVINFPIMKKLKEEDLFWKFPVLDVLFFVYLLVMPFYYFINKNNSRWS